MPVVTGGLAIANAAVGAIGVATSISAAKDATKSQERANQTQQEVNRLRNKQAKRTFLRNFRQAQANALSTAVATGVDIESSAIQGTLVSERSQAETALTEFEEFDRLGAEIVSERNSATSSAFQSNVAGQVSNFARSFLSI